ncbi:hypothetical protein OFO29_45525, partial [Escherichia coli]|nr:hypothetical protein [Escherichia coli]
FDGIVVPFTITDKGSFSNERENDCPEDIKFTASIGIQTGPTLVLCPRGSTSWQRNEDGRRKKRRQ